MRIVDFRMTHRLAMIRPAMAAFAVVLALSSTPLLAQDVPDATQPVAETPATAVPEIDPAAATPIEPTATSVPLAPIAEPVTAKPRKSTTVRRAASVARPASAAAAPAPAAAPALTADAAPIAVAAGPTAPAAAVVATRPAEEASVASGAMLPIAAAVGLGLLGLVVVGVAVRRRRRRNEEELAAADYYEPAVEAPAPAPALETEAAPAFADPLVAELPLEPAAPPPAIVAGAAPAAGLAPAASDCVDAAPGSHVEAACEGPTADNPSLSIKKRLKRARFFDQREFLAEAGEVAPMAADAGLPDAVEAPAPSEREPA